MKRHSYAPAGAACAAVAQCSAPGAWRQDARLEAQQGADTKGHRDLPPATGHRLYGEEIGQDRVCYCPSHVRDVVTVRQKKCILLQVELKTASAWTGGPWHRVWDPAAVVCCPILLEVQS